MAKHDVDQDRVRISVAPPPNSSVKQVDEIYIVVTQAFCQAGHSLITDDNELFDGYPGLRIRVSSPTETGDVIVSPFHGDSSKKGKTDWKSGTRLVLSCPVCGEPLPKLASCRCPGEGTLVKLFLSPTLTDSHVLAMCNVWGCRRSQTINNWQIISEFLDGQIDD